MNTEIRLSPASTVPLRHGSSARHRLTAVLLGLSLPLLAACSSSPATPATTDASGPTTAAATSDSNTPTPTVATNADAFCELAVQEKANSADNAAAMATLSEFINIVVSEGPPLADLNAWGSDLYVIAGRSAAFYENAAPYVAGTDVESDFAVMKTFFMTYTAPLAEIGRDSSDASTFLADASAFFQGPDVQASMTAAPTASQHIANYIAKTCPAIG